MSKGGSCNTSSGICGLALFIIALIVIFVLGIWFVIWYLSDRVRSAVEDSPITKIVVSISGLFVITNDFVRSMLRYVRKQITLEEVKKDIDALSLRLRNELVVLLGDDTASRISALFKEKFTILVDLIDEGATDVPPKLVMVNNQIANEIFPAYRKDIARFLTNIDDNVIDHIAESN